MKITTATAKYLPLAAFSALLLLVSYRAGKYLLRRHFLKTTTILLDVPNIGKARPNNKRIKGTAVVCGGSIAGLWTARLCADHFDDVLVIEPEAWLATEEGKSDVYDEKGNYVDGRRMNTRSRVSQYNATHGYQPLTLIALRKLFPSIDDDVTKAHGRVLESEYRIQCYDGHILQLPEDYPDRDSMKSIFGSRELYERTIRRLVVGSSKRIRWMVGTATRITLDPNDPLRIQSVIVRTHNGLEKTVDASLVIDGADIYFLDCSGRSQIGFKWLKRAYSESLKSGIALSRPSSSTTFDELRDEYDTKQRYRTYKFYVPPEARARLPIPGGYDNVGWIYMFMPRPGLEKEYLLLNRDEGHHVKLLFGGWDDPPVPADISEFGEYFDNFEAAVQNPPPQWVREVVDILLENKEGMQVEDYKFPPLAWIHYERAPFIPHNFVSIGDSVMFLNPTFGQGCTKACIGAVTLDGMLRSSPFINVASIPIGFGRKFSEIHAERIKTAWDGTKPTDYMWDSTVPVKGEELKDGRFAGEFSNLLMEISAKDKKVDGVMWQVRSFLAPPMDLMAPSILAKVLLFYARHRLGLA